eukprot:Gb_05660 [translate_table: standard]
MSLGVRGVFKPQLIEGPANKILYTCFFIVDTRDDANTSICSFCKFTLRHAYVPNNLDDTLAYTDSCVHNSLCNFIKILHSYIRTRSNMSTNKLHGSLPHRNSRVKEPPLYCTLNTFVTQHSRICFNNCTNRS